MLSRVHAKLIAFVLLLYQEEKKKTNECGLVVHHVASKLSILQNFDEPLCYTRSKEYLIRQRLSLLPSPRGVLAVYMTGGSDGASYCLSKKIHEPEILHRKKYLASKFFT